MTYSILPSANDGREEHLRPHYLRHNGFVVELYPTKELALKALLENDPEARANAMKSMEENQPE